MNLFVPPQPCARPSLVTPGASAAGPLIENSCLKLGRSLTAAQPSPPIDGARRGRQMNRAAPQWTLILGTLIVSLSHLWPGTGVLLVGGGEGSKWGGLRGGELGVGGLGGWKKEKKEKKCWIQLLEVE